MSDDRKEKFSLVYDQYIEKIYRFVYIKVSSREVAEDVTSRVFLKAWEAYWEGKKVDNPGAFLYQIARNTVVDHYRESGRTKTVLLDNVSPIADTGTNSYEKAALSADMDLVKRAIRNLKKDHQDVIILYYLEDMPSEQIAKIIGKPAGTVRVIIHRALESLKNQLS